MRRPLYLIALLVVVGRSADAEALPGRSPRGLLTEHGATALVEVGSAPVKRTAALDELDRRFGVPATIPPGLGVPVETADAAAVVNGPGRDLARFVADDRNCDRAAPACEKAASAEGCMRTGATFEAAAQRELAGISCVTLSGHEDLSGFMAAPHEPCNRFDLSLADVQTIERPGLASRLPAVRVPPA